MTWKTHQPYLKGHVFSHEQLLDITAEEVYHWAKFRVYGNSEADENVEPPVHYRQASVLSWKKSISFFMPNSHMEWNEAARTGNPTRSRLLARLLRSMKRFQVQRRGATSRVRRPVTPEEFEQIEELIWCLEDKEAALCAAAYFCFQFAMIGRLDDTAKFRQPDLQPYPKYEDYAVMGRLPWSKNVNEERDAPQQLIFGAMDPRYDTLSLLGLWLEYRFASHPEQNEFIFCLDGFEDPIRIKEKVRKVLSMVLNDDQFQARDLGLLGSHSIRKFAVTFARGNGCSKVSMFF
jgi:hypothetical protein